MLRKNLIILGILVSSLSYGQNTSAPKTTINTTTKKIKLSDESKDHFMFNFTLDNVINGSNSSDSFFKSNVFNPNLGFYFLYDLPIEKSGFSFAPGIGFTFSKVNLDGSLLVQNTQGTSFIKSSYDNMFVSGSNYNYDGSSFYTSWLEVPFEVRWKSKPINGRSRIKVAAGVRAGINLASNSKISYYDKQIQRDITMKLSSFSELNSFRYGATFRIGYGALNLFGYYGLNQLIKDNRNYNNLDLRQYSIGISITGM